MPQRDGLPSEIRLTDFFSQEALGLLKAKGRTLVQQVGLETIRGVVLDVLTGQNIRNSTEALTRRRIATLNLATLEMLAKGTQAHPDFVARLPLIAANILRQKRVPKEERWLALWVLGLTDKGIQNILRDDVALLDAYTRRYMQVTQEVVQQQTTLSGHLQGHLQVASSAPVTLDWFFMQALFNAVGAQTLAIRGSDKSAYGKLFEKLVLGTLLYLLGFERRAIGELDRLERVFWLSSSDDGRESDATLLYAPGQGARFDIGFIGRGNSEISLDKVSRYRREAQFGQTTWYMATLILVDRIGTKSRIVSLAQAIDGTIIQMSANYWPQQVAQVLQRVFGFEHPLVDMRQGDIGDYLKDRIAQVPLEQFFEGD
jgi:hypothetical protein